MGTPPVQSDDIPPELRIRGFDTAPEEMVSKMENAWELNASVYPMARGLYRIESETGEEYHVDIAGQVSGEPQAACLCGDFHFRCGKDGLDCKHIILVKWLVYAGILPPVDADPEQWIPNRLAAAREQVSEIAREDLPVTKWAVYDSLRADIDRGINDPYSIALNDVFQNVQQIQSVAD